MLIERISSLYPSQWSPHIWKMCPLSANTLPNMTYLPAIPQIRSFHIAAFNYIPFLSYHFIHKIRVNKSLCGKNDQSFADFRCLTLRYCMFCVMTDLGAFNCSIDEGRSPYILDNRASALDFTPDSLHLTSIQSHTDPVRGGHITHRRNRGEVRWTTTRVN